MQMAAAVEEATLWPHLPNKVRVSQATVLTGFQPAGADQEQKNINHERI